MLCFPASTCSTSLDACAGGCRRCVWRRRNSENTLLQGRPHTSGASKRVLPCQGCWSNRNALSLRRPARVLTSPPSANLPSPDPGGLPRRAVCVWQLLGGRRPPPVWHRVCPVLRHRGSPLRAPQPERARPRPRGLCLQAALSPGRDFGVPAGGGEPVLGPAVTELERAALPGAPTCLRGCGRWWGRAGRCLPASARLPATGLCPAPFWL